MTPDPSRRWWPPAGLAVLCVAGWFGLAPAVESAPAPDTHWLEVPDAVREAARDHEDPPEIPEPSLIATSLLRGNTVGDTILDGWTLSRIEGPDALGAFALGLRQGTGGTLTVRITPIDAEPHRPPLRTDTFDYFYDSIAADVGIDDREAVDLLRDLAAFVEGDDG